MRVLLKDGSTFGPVIRLVIYPAIGRGIGWLWHCGAVAAAEAAGLECAPLVRAESSVPAMPFDHGLFFGVEHPGTPRSFIFGTMHVADQRVALLPPPVSAAFDRSQHLVMEAVFDAAGLAELRG
jgi:hypothetical protein